MQLRTRITRMGGAMEGYAQGADVYERATPATERYKVTGNQTAGRITSTSIHSSPACIQQLSPFSVQPDPLICNKSCTFFLTDLQNRSQQHKPSVISLTMATQTTSLRSLTRDEVAKVRSALHAA